MKLIAIIIATTVVTASVTFVVSSANKEVVQEERREIRNDRSSKVIAELQKQLKQAKAEAGRVEIIQSEIIVPGASTKTPEAILDYLSKLPMGERNDRGGDTDEHRV